MQDTNFEIQFSNYDDLSILHIYLHFNTTLNCRILPQYMYIFFQYVYVILAEKIMTLFPERLVLKCFLLESLWLSLEAD